MKIRKILKITVLYVLAPIVLVAIGAVAGSVFIVDFAKSAYENSNWLDAEGDGIDEQGFVTLGGFDQFVRIRGRHRSNPVLLDLHGGPGGALTGITHRQYRPLEEYFTLVEWDQRGCGRSTGDEALVATMSYQRMVDDAVELIEHLRGRLGVEKVILVGHSWGSMLGLGVAKQRPDLLYAYVGVGQALAWEKGFVESKRLLLAAAREAGDTGTVAALSAVPDTLPPKGDDEALMDFVASIQGHLSDYGGGWWALEDRKNATGTELTLDLLFSPDTTISELIGGLRGGGPSPVIFALLHDLHDLDRLDDPDYAVFETPIFIFQGEHDWQTPNTQVKQWFARIEAPYKEYIPFSDSAHIVIYEEPGKYLDSLVNRVRPLALEDRAEPE